ncbi:hypothetical protein ACJIZ3_023064 [Penstemon smallii]|uniref:Uncharacterized protein n=1 Tax=Penstemon smallii TaxID=265156 RepID=A0ABD3TQX8_9LAMI
MSDSVEVDGLWLPAEFFTDDDFLVEKENLMKNSKSAINDSEFCFPTEFPYLMSTSPQSTLDHVGISSPPTRVLGSRNDAVGDPVYRAAGQAAKLKLSGGDGFVGFGPGPGKPRNFLGPETGFAPHFQQQRVVRQHQNQSCGVWHRQQQMGQAAWAIQQSPTRVLTSGTRPVLMSGSGSGAVKRGCAGTGVFIPRRYNDGSALYNSDSRKKPACTTSFLPNRPVLTKNFDSMSGFTQPKPVPQPQLDRAFIQEYEMLMARRQAMILQQRRSLLLAEGSSRMSCDTYLPQEWTY